jgi:thiamine pyrophosphate-dependent acetolactate synthase large subunit-like protein
VSDPAGRRPRRQLPALGDDVGTTLRAADYHLVGQGYGGEGILVRRSDEVADALRRGRARALAAAGRPVVVNVLLARSGFRQGSMSM